MSLTYAQAAEMWRTRRKTRDGLVKLATNTFLYPVPNPEYPERYLGYAVRYHQTDIITIHPDDTYTLTTGGWWTVTTKTRLQEYAPIRLAQVNNLWYFRRQEQATTLAEYIYPTLFFDGLRVDTKGYPINPKSRLQAETIQHNAKILDREVSAYIKGFAAHVREHGLDDPSSSDCWGCYFRDAEKKTAECFSLEHYREHFREPYYVPSLLWNAIKELGYADPSLIWHFATAKDGNLTASRDNYHLTHALRRFFQRRKPALLGLTATVPVKTGSVTIGQAVGASQARKNLDAARWGR